jgi:hypothetical protein
VPKSAVLARNPTSVATATVRLWSSESGSIGLGDRRSTHANSAHAAAAPTAHETLASDEATSTRPVAAKSRTAPDQLSEPLSVCCSLGRLRWTMAPATRPIGRFT